MVKIWIVINYTVYVCDIHSYDEIDDLYFYNNEIDKICKTEAEANDYVISSLKMIIDTYKKLLKNFKKEKPKEIDPNKKLYYKEKY